MAENIGNRPQQAPTEGESAQKIGGVGDLTGSGPRSDAESVSIDSYTEDWSVSESEVADINCETMVDDGVNEDSDEDGDDGDYDGDDGDGGDYDGEDDGDDAGLSNQVNTIRLHSFCSSRKLTFIARSWRSRTGRTETQRICRQLPGPPRNLSRPSYRQLPTLYLRGLTTGSNQRQKAGKYPAGAAHE
jgi:hypothetical protein